MKRNTFDLGDLELLPDIYAGAIFQVVKLSDDMEFAVITVVPHGQLG